MFQVVIILRNKTWYKYIFHFIIAKKNSSCLKFDRGIKKAISSLNNFKFKFCMNGRLKKTYRIIFQCKLQNIIVIIGAWKQMPSRIYVFCFFFYFQLNKLLKHLWVDTCRTFITLVIFSMIKKKLVIDKRIVWLEIINLIFKLTQAYRYHRIRRI